MQYFRGTVDQYNEHGGYGYIRAEDLDTQELLLVHRGSLRSGLRSLRKGDRVLFSTEKVDRGLLATDVHHELVEEPDPLETAQERVTGTVSNYFSDRGFGFIRLPDGKNAFFHISQLADSSVIPTQGSTVHCQVVTTEKGAQAQDIELEVASTGNISATTKSDIPTHPAPQDYLVQAIVARDQRRFDQAAELYEKGLRGNPSAHLVLSYAALEKNRGRKSAAMRVYEEGIKLFPEHAKLREDAGVLAASIGDLQKALKFLRESLEICRRLRQGGEKGVLLALGRANYRIGTFNSLNESVHFYEEALKLYGRGQTRLPEADLLALNIARIRTSHHRGNQTVQFLRSAYLKIVKARLFDQRTEGAEFVVQIDDPEFKESYGIAQYLVVRCMFKANVTRGDLEALDQSVTNSENADVCDSQVALLVVSSLPDDLQRVLWKRIEERRKEVLAIVPIQQSEIESPGAPLATLRGVLDRWLYRRDLFSGSGPVVGRRFFGRNKPLAELRDAITNSTPTAVFGLRKVGKTSILRESQRRASESGDIVVYVDLLRVPSDISDCQWLYWKIASGLRGEFEKLPIGGMKWRLGGEYIDYLDVPASVPIATAFDSDLTRLLQYLSKLQVTPKPKVVLLLDEIERLLPTQLGKPGFTGFFDFFSYLRGVSQENDNFLVIVTGANAIITEASQFETRDNPVFNFFKEIYLQLLEPAESEFMIQELGRGMGMRFTKVATGYIHGLTGGHPFFTRQLCSFVAENRRERPVLVDKPLVESLVDRYLDVRSGDFQEIVDRLRRDFPGELEVCVALARAGGSLPIEAIRDQTAKQVGSTIRHLKGYQIVGIDEKRAYLTIDLLTRWLRQRYSF